MSGLKKPRRTDLGAELTGRHLVFVNEYLQDFNAARAARAAGYSAKTSDSAGARLLRYPAIKAAVEAGKAKIAAAIDVDKEWIVKRLMRVADADIRRCFREDGSLRPVHELDDNAAAAIAAIEVIIDETGGKRAKITSRTAKVRLRDSVRALEALAKYKGMYTDAPLIPPADPMTDAKRQEALRLVVSMLEAMAHGRLMKPVVLEHAPQKGNGSAD
jgi:phage terminase small subunit